MISAMEVERATSWPNFDSGFWAVSQSLLLLVAALVLYKVFFPWLDSIVSAVVFRLRSGATLKFFSIELGEVRISEAGESSSSAIQAEEDATGEWKTRRDEQYECARALFPVHRLYPSSQPDQLYDVLIYLSPHPSRSGSLWNVMKVEYFFGQGWGNRIYAATDRGKRFGISVSANGSGFLVLIRVHFKDGQTWDTARYVDLENGMLGSGAYGRTARD